MSDFDFQEVLKRINDHEKRIRALEGDSFVQSRGDIKQSGSNRKRGNYSGATGGLKILWKEKVFKDWVKIADVVQEFSKRGCNFPLASVDKALQRAKYLTRKGKRGNYRYIQKHPFTTDEE